MLTIVLLAVIGVLIYYIGQLRDKLTHTESELTLTKNSYTMELNNIRKEVSEIQLSGNNLNRNLAILTEIGLLLDRLTKLKMLGVTNGDPRILEIVTSLKDCRSRLC